MQKQRGFTLIELMVVLVIAGILIAVAIPSFKRLIQSNSITNGVNTFMADLRYARSESIRRGGGVIMCRSNDPEAAAPVCNTGSGTDGNGWVSGWIIFHDLNNNGAKNTDEPVLRIQSRITSIDSIVEAGTPVNKFRFTATGRMLNVSSATQLQFGGNANFENDIQRVMCVSLGGRARVAGSGTASCGTGSEANQ